MELDEIAEDIFSNFGLALQIIEDFREGTLLPDVSLTEEQIKSRDSVLSALLIDTTLRRADYAKFYCDGDQAKTDFTDVIKLCDQYPEGNLRIKSSAYFSRGSIFLDQNNRKEAKESFEEALNITKAVLIKELKAKGQNLEMDNVTVQKLIEPSIFDDESIQDLKATLTEMQEFINECKDMETIQPELDKLKAEAEKNKTEYGEYDAP